MKPKDRIKNAKKKSFFESVFDFWWNNLKLIKHVGK